MMPTEPPTPYDRPDNPEPITRTFINHDKTVLATLWPNGKLDVQTRPTGVAEWGMPVRCSEEL